MPTALFDGQLGQIRGQGLFPIRLTCKYQGDTYFRGTRNKSPEIFY